MPTSFTETVRLTNSNHYDTEDFFARIKTLRHPIGLVSRYTTVAWSKGKNKVFRPTQGLSKYHRIELVDINDQEIELNIHLKITYLSPIISLVIVLIMVTGVSIWTGFWGFLVFGVLYCIPVVFMLSKRKQSTLKWLDNEVDFLKQTFANQA